MKQSAKLSDLLNFETLQVQPNLHKITGQKGSPKLVTPWHRDYHIH